MHYDLSIGRKDTQIVPCHQVPRFRQTEFSPVFNSFHSTDEDRLVVVRLNEVLLLSAVLRLFEYRSSQKS